jgi:hypothetical protein
MDHEEGTIATKSFYCESSLLPPVHPPFRLLSPFLQVQNDSFTPPASPLPAY